MMSEKLVLVTGATGNAGFTALQCITKCGGCSVRALSYNKSPKRDLVRELDGLEAVYEIDADVIDTTFESAFAGVDCLYIIPSRSRNRLQHVKNYVELAKKNGVKFILLFSMLRPTGSTSGYARAYAAMEAVVEDSGIQYSIIRNTLQQQALFLFQPDIAKGVLPLPLGRGEVAPVNICDVSRLACTIFSNPKQHYSKAYHLTGPDLLTGPQMAQLASEALGKNIRYVNISPANCKSLLMDSGLEEWLADEFVEMFGEIASGKFGSLVTKGLYTSLTGCNMVSLKTFFKNHYERFVGVTVAKPTEAVPEGADDRAIRSKAVTSAVTGVASTGISGVYAGKGRRGAQVVSFDRDLVIDELARTEKKLMKWTQILDQLVGEFFNFKQEVTDTLNEVQ